MTNAANWPPILPATGQPTGAEWPPVPVPATMDGRQWCGCPNRTVTAIDNPSGPAPMAVHWDGAWKHPGIVLGNSNKTAISSLSGAELVLANVGRDSGILVFEVTFDSADGLTADEVGIADHNVDPDQTGLLGGQSNAWVFRISSARQHNGSGDPVFPTDNYTGSSYQPLTLLVVVNFDEGSMRVRGPNGWVNREWGSFGGTDNYLYTSGISGTRYPAASVFGSGAAADSVTINGGDSPFVHEAHIPAGAWSWDGSRSF